MPMMSQHHDGEPETSRLCIEVVSYKSWWLFKLASVFRGESAAAGMLVHCLDSRLGKKASGRAQDLSPTWGVSSFTCPKSKATTSKQQVRDV